MDKNQKIQIESILETSILGGKRRFIICPYGVMGRYVKSVLWEKYDIEPYAIIDNFSKEDGVWNVDELKKHEIPDDVFVILISVFIEIQSGFQKMLMPYFPKEKIINVLGKNNESCLEENKSEDVKLKESLEKGHEIIRNIATDRNKLYFMYSEHNGDIIAASSLMESAKRVYGYAQAVFVCLKRHRDIAKMFDAFDEVVEVSTEEMNHIRCVASHFGYMWGENYILGNTNHLHRCWMVYDNFLDAFKLTILQIPEKCKPSRLSNQIFTRSKEELKRIYGKMVMIAPYANSFANFPLEFWQLIVSELGNKGYGVLCNVFGKEQEIPGTTRLEKGLAETLEISYGCAGVISNRSGFSDLVAFNYDVPHVVIYPDEKMSSYWDISVFGSEKTYKVEWKEAYRDLAKQIVERLLL